MPNIILTNLSSLSDTAEERLYKSDIGIIKGINTNDAPVKYFISDLNNQDKEVGKIIAVATKEALSAYGEFCNMLLKYSEETGIKIPKPEKVNTSEDTIASAVKNIIDKISVDDHVYIDTTGGFRNSSYLLMGVIRVLEYSNIRFEKAIYSRFDRNDSNLNVIEDITELYRIFDLINAVNTFTSVGNSYELEEYFKGSENETIKRTIQAMNVFSDEITLCRTSKLNDVLNELNHCLDELSKVQSNEKDIILFKSLSEVIKKKFNVHNGKIEYPAIVKWCLDNRLIQQAVTIYVENMPEYFFKKGYFTIPDDELETIKKNNDKSKFNFYYDLFYNNFMKKSKSLYDINDIMILLSNIQTKTSNCNKTEEQIICDAIIEYSDFSAFKDKLNEKNIYQRHNIESKKEYLEKLFTVKKAIYFNGELCSESEINEGLKEYPQLRKMLQNKKNVIQKNVKSFLKSISNNQKLANAIFNNKINRYSCQQLNFIENIGSGDGYNLTEKLTNEELKKLFRDIYYTKIFIRNKLNHASEDKNISDEITAYFDSYGYKINDELTVRYISDIIYNALETIRN